MVPSALMPVLLGALQAALALPLLAAAIIVLVLYSDPAVRRAHRISKTFPQPSRLPVIGHLLHLLVSREELFWLGRSFRKLYGSRFVITMFARPCWNVSDPQAVEAVLSSSKHIAKSRIYDFLKPWLGQGLLTSQGKLWHSRRKMLTPAFHFRILDKFAEHLEDQARSLVAELEAARRNLKRGQPLNVVPFISRTTLRSICVTAMGKVDFKTDSSGTSEKSYFDAVHRVGTACVNRLVRPWLWIPFIFRLTKDGRGLWKDLRILHGFTEKVIADRKSRLFGAERDASEEGNDGDDAVAERDDGVRRRSPLRPFLDVLLNAQRQGASLSDRDIREEVDTFMFEGHDTTSMALSWALELLGRHLDVQELLAEELLGADSDWEAVSKLPYLDKVFKECLRLRPSVPFISRWLDTDVVLDDGEQVIPAYSAVHVHIFDLHRHPDSFPDPERFDPERFSPEQEQARHPFAYVPFSAGPRNCIGKRFAVMEVKLLLAAVVRRFVVRSAMPDKMEVMADLVLRPRDGLFLELEPRTAPST